MASLAVGAERPTGGDDGVTLDRQREDEPGVVVGVLADEIDPPRGGDNPLRRIAEDLGVTAFDRGDLLGKRGGEEFVVG